MHDRTGRWFGFSAALLALIGAGCGSSGPMPPETYTTTGTVSYKNGAMLDGGTIEFRSVADPNLTMMGAIESDGTFELSTIFQSEKLPGAMEGKCQVTVHPPVKQMPPPDPYRLPQPLTIEKKDNHFVIEIPALRTR